MDLQIVIDEIAAVMYLCNYLTKGEKAMGEPLKCVAKECRNDDICTQMKKTKNEFLGKRTLAAPETAMRVLSMWFMKKVERLHQSTLICKKNGSVSQKVMHNFVN